MNSALKVQRRDEAVTLQLAYEHHQQITAILAAPDAARLVARLHAELARLGWQPHTAAVGWHALATRRDDSQAAAAYAWLRCVAQTSPWQTAD